MHDIIMFDCNYDVIDQWVNLSAYAISAQWAFACM